MEMAKCTLESLRSWQDEVEDYRRKKSAWPLSCLSGGRERAGGKTDFSKEDQGEKRNRINLLILEEGRKRGKGVAVLAQPACSLQMQREGHFKAKAFRGGASREDNTRRKRVNRRERVTYVTSCSLRLPGTTTEKKTGDPGKGSDPVSKLRLTSYLKKGGARDSF